MRAEGIEYLSALEQLEALSVGIYNLESFDFLVAIPNGIKTLSLGPTKSKKPRLDSLVRFQSLNKLCIAGQQQRIEALAELQTLEDLSLRRISTPDLDYISRLPRLSSLDIKLGGIRNLSAIQGKASIKYLELWRIRGLSDITVISSLTGLQYLFLQDLRNVISIPDLSKLTKLHRIYLENMKGLEDFGAVSTAPALEDFIHVSAQNVSPASYKGLLAMPTLRQVRVRFCSQKKNQEFDRLVAQSGKSANPPSKFGFS
jgi:Leucine-rich repeat (LRR) protein